MNWKLLRLAPWVDTRARFVASLPRRGTLLDLGSSDGETLCHFAELRPDLKLRATDIAGTPDAYPAGCDFHRGDICSETLPWDNNSVDGITCMHLVEHLPSLTKLFDEAARVLKPGARLYVETPRPKSVILDSPKGAMLGNYTLNFFDDVTHVRPVVVSTLAREAERVKLTSVGSGVSRNLLFVSSYSLFAFLPPSRRKYTAYAHFKGWSAYYMAEKR